MASLTPDETILGLLAAQTQHGYELLECFRDPAQLGEVWNLSTSQLYAVLKRLDQQGLIAGREIRSENAPPRMEYCLTEAGAARLKDWLNDAQPSASIRRVRVEFLSRLYVARLLNIPTISIVKSQKMSCRAMRESLVVHRDQSVPGVGYLAVDMVIAQLDAVLQWIDRCELVPKDMKEGEDED